MHEKSLTKTDIKYSSRLHLTNHILRDNQLEHYHSSASDIYQDYTRHVGRKYVQTVGIQHAFTILQEGK